MSRKRKTKQNKTIQNTKINEKPKARSVVFGIISIAITCLNLITILTIYRGIIILLPAPGILGAISLFLAKKDKNETGFVYGTIAVIMFCTSIIALSLLYSLIQFANANAT